MTLLVLTNILNAQGWGQIQKLTPDDVMSINNDSVYNLNESGTCYVFERNTLNLLMNAQIIKLS